MENCLMEKKGADENSLSTLQGISKHQVNEARLSEDLDNYWEVLAEPIQKEAKTNILKLTPHEYVGAAVELARAVDTVVNLVDGKTSFESHR
ncbi:hypothetical protein FNV43_RR02419 [Rhamnella rubrinervis]|uniref:Uncharacterized protein n=1 Tax=Rhamnella rubrinervis TaxID=2594499 RepID=A0A8K0MU03_9ROSA|nr:hypothetical protein FNV43_RR02419 [Rhamnella rubrinervis]